MTSFGGGVYLSANGEESTHVTYKTASSIDDGWTRIAVSFVATSSNALYFYCDRIHGSVHLDDVQLELGEAPGSTDLLANGTADATSGWTLVNGTQGSATGITGKAIQLNSDPDTDATASQTVSIYLPGSESFLFSGWAKAVAMPDNTGEEVKKLSLHALVTYTDGTTEEHEQEFNSDLTDWQYASLMIVPKAPEKTVRTIKTTCDYGYNNGVALFDNLSLTRQVAQTYTYNDDAILSRLAPPTRKMSTTATTATMILRPSRTVPA